MHQSLYSWCISRFLVTFKATVLLGYHGRDELTGTVALKK